MTTNFLNSDLNEAARVDVNAWLATASERYNTTVDMLCFRLKDFEHIIRSTFGSVLNGGKVDVTDANLHNTYKKFCDKCAKEGTWTNIIIDTFQLTTPVSFARFVADPYVCSRLKNNAKVEVVGVKEVNAEIKREERERLKTEKRELAAENKKNDINEKTSKIAAIAKELFDYHFGDGLEEDRNYASALNDKGYGKLIYVVRSKYYPEIPALFVKSKADPENPEELLVNTGSDIPDYGENVSLQLPARVIMDYLYLDLLVNDVYNGYDDFVSNLEEGYNPRWLPSVCYLDYFIAHPVPSAEERRRGNINDDTNTEIASLEAEDIAMAESVNIDTDRIILKRLVESYGKEDVLNYINNLDE